MATNKSGAERMTLNKDDVGSVGGPGSDVVLAADSPEALVQDALDQFGEGWQEEQVGFAPYWNPAKKNATGDEDSTPKTIRLGKDVVEYRGNIFVGSVINFDDRDPNFPRYTIQASMPVECHMGPAEDAERAIVKKGEEFTLSAYAALPLYKFFGMEIICIAVKKRKLPPNEASEGVKRDLWMFKVLVSPNNKEKLKSKRLEEAKKAAELAASNPL